MSLSHALFRYTRPKPRRPSDACELCSQPLAGAHRHAVHLERRNLLCVCRPCALLFTEAGAANGALRTVPERVLVEPDVPVDEALWSALEVPVRLAFLFFNSSLQRVVACYPSPAGATESELVPERWDAFREHSALARALEPDVEGLLVHAKGRVAGKLELLLVPIDACYELVGLVRRHWKGFDGGDARAHIDAFVAALSARASVLRSAGPGHAS